jgi:hypothetical protein
MKTNEIPKALDTVIGLGSLSLAGAQSIGVAVGLEHNTAVKIAPELYDVIGDPATPLVPGKQSKYAAQKVAVKQAFGGRALAIKAGVDFCRNAVNALKPVLGNRWNTQWNGAGFVTPSISVPTDPVPMLVKFREFFNANPAREVASLNVTAVLAQQRLTQIETAHLAVAEARNELLVRKAQRDLAVRVLRGRLSDLRSELDQLLNAEDGRWYDFGFRRPADRRMPDDVTGLALAPAGPGAIAVSWEPAALAENYRVGWRPEGAPIEAVTEVGLFGDLQALISGLPSGMNVIVGVSARNDSGETQATEATITVP